eukprot:gene16806-23088_t
MATLKKRALDKVEADMAALKKRAGMIGTERAKIGKGQAQVEAALEQLSSKAADLISTARMEQVDLLRNDSTKQQCVADCRRVQMNMDTSNYLLHLATTSYELSPPAILQVDLPTKDSTKRQRVADDEEGQTGIGNVDAELSQLDFSELPRPLSSKSMGAKEKEAAERQIQQKIADVMAEMEKSAPNMKALEQFEAVKEKEREVNAALDQARQETQSAADAFRKVHQRRYDTFMAAFTHISQEIDVIYKDLTRSGPHPLGGTAYLSLEDTDNPFLSGIKYTAMPPTKRFRDMEQLSGGEKTVAALALLFAIHSYRPSPFFVLDEVDAALDATNVARVAHYIRNKTRKEREAGNPFQSIVISLKDIFYEKADALVGVARDVDLGCSRTFTFDLNRFEAPQEADAR